MSLSENMHKSDVQVQIEDQYERHAYHDLLQLTSWQILLSLHVVDQNCT